MNRRGKKPLVRTGVTVLGASFLLATLSPASAGAVLAPDGNSAVSQYTEAFPTARGPKESNQAVNESRSPAAVLGKRTARRLDAAGPDGRATAELAAASAPAGGGEGGGSGAGARGGAGSGSAAAGGDGSSGLGQVLGEATGTSSSGRLGLFLPLIIGAALASSLVFLLRRRRGVS